MEWKTCKICGHEFGGTEERELLVCEHGTMLCPCGTYGYVCLSHDRDVPRVNGKKEPMKLSVMVLPGNWELEVVSAGLQVLKATMRQPLTVGADEMGINWL